APGDRMGNRRSVRRGGRGRGRPDLAHPRGHRALAGAGGGRVSTARGHTPGPWVVNEGTRGDRGVFEDGGLVICWIETYPRDPGEVRANEALIAAAPDLLAALEGLLADDFEEAELELAVGPGG